MPSPLNEHPLADALVVEAGLPRRPSTPSRLFAHLGLSPRTSKAQRQRRLTAWLRAGNEPSPLLRQLLEEAGFELAVPARPTAATGARIRIGHFLAWYDEQLGRESGAGVVLAGRRSGDDDRDDLAVHLDGGTLLRVNRRGPRAEVELVEGPTVQVDGVRLGPRPATFVVPADDDVVDWLSDRLTPG